MTRETVASLTWACLAMSAIRARMAPTLVVRCCRPSSCKLFHPLQGLANVPATRPSSMGASVDGFCNFLLRAHPRDTLFPYRQETSMRIRAAGVVAVLTLALTAAGCGAD